MLLTITLVAVVAGVSLALARRPRRLLLSYREGVTVVVLPFVAFLQVAVRGSVSFDDVMFTPIYLAAPVWLGVLGGASEGFAGMALAAGPLFGVAALTATAVPDSGADWLSAASAQYSVIAIALVAIGTLAGLARRYPLIAASSVLVWIVPAAALHFDLLRSLTPWIISLSGAALALAGLVVRAVVAPALERASSRPADSGPAS